MCVRKKKKTGTEEQMFYWQLRFSGVKQLWIQWHHRGDSETAGNTDKSCMRVCV